MRKEIKILTGKDSAHLGYKDRITFQPQEIEVNGESNLYYNTKDGWVRCEELARNDLERELQDSGISLEDI
jgi:hypothetical protein